MEKGGGGGGGGGGCGVCSKELYVVLHKKCYNFMIKLSCIIMQSLNAIINLITKCYVSSLFRFFILVVAHSSYQKNT